MSIADLGAVLKVGSLVISRQDVDELLTNRALEHHARFGTLGRDLVLLFDEELDLHALVHDFHVAYLAHGDAAVGDLLVREDTTGIGEEGEDGITILEHE